LAADVTRSLDRAAPVQAHVFDAISEGRKGPVTHAPPGKADCGALAAV